jgi:glucose/arabinose dehydrogenase
VFGVLLLVLVALVMVVATANGAEADLDDLRIELVEVASGFDQPILVTPANDGAGTRFVVEQSGRIWTLAADGSPGALLLDLSDDVAGANEQGLLGLAFHPDFGDNGRFFVNVTRRSDGATVISEFESIAGHADRASERRLMVIEQPFGNHNGGALAFDAAGQLLLGPGDGGSGGDPQGNGQNPDSLLGKLLRIDVDSADAPYGIPQDNGFAATDAHRPEIHAKGLRNPWRLTVDPLGGHIYIGDVGQNKYEEISVLPGGMGGQSFGWSDVEGPECFRDGCDLDAHTPPVLSYDHDQGCTVIGGHVYRGSEQPGLEGVYLFGDLCSGTIWGASASEMVAGAATAAPIGNMDGTLVSFGTDEAGELYAVDHGGRIFHLVTEAS